MLLMVFALCALLFVGAPLILLCLGSRDGALVRELASHQCSPGSISGVDTISDMWVEILVGSRPCSKGFSLATPVFLSRQKPRFSYSCESN